MFTFGSWNIIILRWRGLQINQASTRKVRRTVVFTHESHLDVSTRLLFGGMFVKVYYQVWSAILAAVAARRAGATRPMNDLISSK